MKAPALLGAFAPAAVFAIVAAICIGAPLLLRKPAPRYIVVEVTTHTGPIEGLRGRYDEMRGRTVV